MRIWGDVFAGHPVRIALGALVLVVGVAVVWYLASPLWIRTERHEDLPEVLAPPASAVVAPVITPAASGARVITPAPTAFVQRLFKGELNYVDSIHNGSGPVYVLQISGGNYLRFEDVTITNAPDVHVYLSKDTGGKYVPANTLYLGALKATNGSFNYEIPVGTDVGAYKSVVVWCRAFFVLITWADLKPAG